MHIPVIIFLLYLTFTVVNSRLLMLFPFTLIEITTTKQQFLQLCLASVPGSWVHVCCREMDKMLKKTFNNLIRHHCSTQIRLAYDVLKKKISITHL